MGYVGGQRWRWGLKTNFKIFLKGIFVQEGSNGTRFDHGQFEVKIFLFTPHPTWHAGCDLGNWAGMPGMEFELADKLLKWS